MQATKLRGKDVTIIFVKPTPLKRNPVATITSSFFFFAPFLASVERILLSYVGQMTKFSGADTEFRSLMVQDGWPGRK